MTDEQARQEYDWMPEARQIAAQCWCDEETKRKPMDPELVEAFARRLAAWMRIGSQHARNEQYLCDQIKTMSVCALGIVNHSVAGYMKHWEDRAEKAEAVLAARDKQAEPACWINPADLAAMQEGEFKSCLVTRLDTIGCRMPLYGALPTSARAEVTHNRSTAE